MNRPSHDDDERDLLGRARRRLPPEVDVIGLATDPPTGGADMSVASTLPRAAAPLIAGVVALSGCADSGSEIRTAAAHSRSGVMVVSRDVLSGVDDVAALPRPAQGSWRSCRDKEGWLQYFVTGRLDPLPDAATGDRLVVRVTAALEQRRYQLRRIRPRDPHITLEAVRGEVNVQLTGYPDEDVMLFDISGRCVEVGDLDGELRGQPPEEVS